MKLTILATLLGLAYGVPQIYGLLKPAKFSEALRRFPRSEKWGFGLMSLGTLWFLYNLKMDDIADFAAFKPVMFVGFAVIGFGACAFVRDFLAVRGLAVVVLLLANLVLDTACWADTQWRLILSFWSYAWIILAIWFTISPWRLRDYITWLTASEGRLKLTCVLRLAFGVALVIVALTAYRAAEARPLLP
jgi:hypothetical protein